MSCLQLSRGRFWLQTNVRESFTRRRGTSLRTTLKRSMMVCKLLIYDVAERDELIHLVKFLIIFQNKTRGPERALNSGESSTMTGCILHKNTTVTPSERAVREERWQDFKETSSTAQQCFSPHSRDISYSSNVSAVFGLWLHFLVVWGPTDPSCFSC